MRNYIGILFALLGIALTPWMIRTFFPGLPLQIEGQPEQFYWACDESTANTTWILNANYPAPAGATCHNGSLAGWKSDGEIKDASLSNIGNGRYRLSVKFDGVEGENASYHYRCTDGKPAPIWSNSKVMGIPFPDFGLLTSLIFWAFFALDGALLTFVLRRASKR